MNRIKSLFSASLVGICLAAPACRSAKAHKDLALDFHTRPIEALFAHALTAERGMVFAAVNNDPPNAPQLWKIDLCAMRDKKHPHQATLSLHNNPLGIADTLFIQFENETHYFVTRDFGIDRQIKQRRITTRDIVYYPTEDTDFVGRKIQGFSLNP